MYNGRIGHTPSLAQPFRPDAYKSPGYRGLVLSSAEVVRRFFERMEARDWDGAEQLLSPSLHIAFTETGEHFRGGNFLAMNRAYPEGWAIEVVEVIADANRVAAQVRVVQGQTTFWCAGFYEVADGRVQSGTEHWVTEHSEQPPVWRERFVG